jgi:hypothetical protein
VNNDDFLNALAGVDILEAEAVSEVIGRVVAQLFKGMVAAGMSEPDAHRVIRGAFAELAKATLGPRS